MSITIEPTGATLGAYVRGVTLAALDDTAWQQILDAFHQYAVLVFPGQHLTPSTQQAFGRRFGEIEVLRENSPSIPITNKGAAGEMLGEQSFHMQLLRGNEEWHTDSSYMPLASKAAVLSAQVVPKSHGGTEWADMRAAYDALDDVTKARIAHLNAHHDYFYSQGRIGHKVEVGQAYGFFEGTKPLRPLVKVHPVTGRKSLFIGRHACDIPGMTREESQKLIDDLQAFACQAPRVFLHMWTPGDVVVWDNRCLLHRARPYDVNEERRLLHTRIAGDPATETALAA